MTLSIGIRELRQQASRYVAAARAGEDVVVTDRGEPVAKLVPLTPMERRLQRLVDRWEATPPRDRSVRPWQVDVVEVSGVEVDGLLADTRAERLS